MGFTNAIYRSALNVSLAVLLTTADIKADPLQLAENPFGSPAALPGNKK